MSTWAELTASIKYGDGKVRCTFVSDRRYYGQTAKLIMVSEISEKITVRWDQGLIEDDAWGNPSSFEVINPFTPATSEQIAVGQRVLCIYKEAPNPHAFQTGKVRAIDKANGIITRISIDWDDKSKDFSGWQYASSFHILEDKKQEPVTQKSPEPIKEIKLVPVGAFDWDVYNGIKKPVKMFPSLSTKKNIDPYTGLPLEKKNG